MQIRNGVKVLSPPIALIVSVAVLMTTMAALLPAPVAAGPQDMSVRGNVWDSAYRDVEGADVVVNIKDGATQVSTDSDTTDANGFYSVIFLAAEWDVGNTIEIVVTYESNQDTNWTTAVDAAIHYINMTYIFEIPEFGNFAGMAIAAFALGGVGVAVMIIWRRK